MQNGLSQKEFARILGFDPIILSRIERDCERISWGVIKKVDQI